MELDSYSKHLLCRLGQVTYPLGPEVFCMKVGVMNLHRTIAVVSKDFSIEYSICGCPKLLSIMTVLFIAFMHVDT